MYSCEHLQKKIQEFLPGSDVEVWDTRNDGNHFQARVFWEGFSEMSLVERHKKVYEAIDEEMKAGLHSISIKAKVKKEN